MAKKCPECGRNSLDYDPNFKKWKCVWINCFYSEDLKENEDLEKNEMIKIKIKKIGKNSKLPTRMKDGDAGYDCFIHRFVGINFEEKKLFNLKDDEGFLSSLSRGICYLGFTTEIPKGYYAQLVPRSGLALWDGLTIINAPATIDSGYRNEWGVIVINLSDKEIELKIGDRICQMIIRKLVDFEFKEVEELNESERGLDGIGSTGK